MCKIWAAYDVIEKMTSSNLTLNFLYKWKLEATLIKIKQIWLRYIENWLHNKILNMYQDFFEHPVY